jgi:hypothetical protein
MALTLSTLTLLPLLIGPSPEPPSSTDASSEAESAELADPAPPTSTSGQKREWMLVIAPGFDYVAGARQAFKAYGGGFRLGGHAIKWAGAKGRFLVGGGPMLHYTYLKDPDFNDTLQLVTANGDLLLGGGNQRFGVYWHATAGLGYLAAFDAQTNTKIQTVGVRAATGIGGFGKINDRFSVGALVDFGWAGGLWVNALLTANVHFGRRGDPL